MKDLFNVNPRKDSLMSDISLDAINESAELRRMSLGPNLEFGAVQDFKPFATKRRLSVQDTLLTRKGSGRKRKPLFNRDD